MSSYIDEIVTHFEVRKGYVFFYLFFMHYWRFLKSSTRGPLFLKVFISKKKKKSQYQNNHILLRKLNIFYFRSIFRGEKTAHRGARALNSFLILHLVWYHTPWEWGEYTSPTAKHSWKKNMMMVTANHLQRYRENNFNPLAPEHCFMVSLFWKQSPKEIYFSIIPKSELSSLLPGSSIQWGCKDAELLCGPRRM